MRRRPVWLTSLLGLGCLVGGAVLVSSGGILWLRSPTGAAWAEQRLLGAINETIPGEVSLGSIDLQLPRGLEARQLLLADANGEPLVSVDALSLRLLPRRLLSRELRIPVVRLDGVVVHLEQGPGGQLGLLDALGVVPADPRAPTPPPAPWGGIGSFSVHLDEVVLSGVELFYRGTAQPSGEHPEVVVRDGLVETKVWMAGTRVEVPHLRLGGVLVAPVETPVSLDAAGVFDAGMLTLADLSVTLETTTLQVGGSVATLETDPVLALDVAVRNLDPDEVNRLAGAPLFAETVGLEGSVRGALDALVVDAEVAAPEAGTLALDGVVNLQADPLDWRIAAQTARFDLARLLPAVTEPVVVEGDWVVDGEGTDWPEGVTAEVSVASGPTVLWGEPFRAFELKGRLEQGLFRLTRLRGVHSVGTLVAEGDVDLSGATASAAITAAVPQVSALKRFGLDGADGSAEFTGSVDVQWMVEPLLVDVSGRLVGAHLGLEGMDVAVARAVVPVRAQVRGSRVEASGSLVAQSLLHPTASAEVLRSARWTATVADDGSVSVEADVDATVLDVGSGALVLDGVSGVLSGGLDAKGAPHAQAALQLSSLALVDSDLSSDGGPVSIQFGEDTVSVSAELGRDGQAVLGGQVGGDLASGIWQIEGLVLAPVVDVPWLADGPVGFRLVEDGVQDLSARLVSGGGSVSVSGDWLGPDAAGSHLVLTAETLDLGVAAALADAVAPQATGDDAPWSGLAGVLDLEASLHGANGEQGASVSVEAGLSDLGVPDVATGAQVALEIEGPLEQPRLWVEAGPSGKAPLARLEGVAPLALSDGLPVGVACGTPGSFRLVLLPSELSAFEEILGDLGLPDGRASLELRASQDVCNPEIVLTGAAEVVAGMRGERLRFDLEGGRHAGAVHVRAELEEQLARRLTLDIDLETHLEAVLGALLAPAAAASTPDTALLSTWVEHMDVRLVPMELPLSTLGRLTSLPPTLGGVLGGGVHLRGAPSAPVVEGALLVVDGQVGTMAVEQAEITLTPLETPGDYRVAAVSSFGHRGEEGGIAIGGQVPLGLNLDADDPLDLEREGVSVEVYGDGIPLGLLVGLAEGVSAAEGRVALTGSAAGSLARPAFDLQAKLMGGSVVSEGLGVQFRDLELLARATPGLVELQRARASSAPLFGLRTESETRFGTLTMLGRISLDNLQASRVNLDLSANRFWLSNKDNLRLAVDADLDLRGLVPNLGLQGGVRVVTGEVALSQEFFAEGSSLELAPVLTVHRKRALDRQQRQMDTSLLNTMTVDLEVDFASGLSLGATVPTSTDYGDQFAELSSVGVGVVLLAPEPLRLEMREGDSQLFGGLEANRGDLNIMGKGFSVTPGSALGFNGDLSDPTLSIQAVHRTAQYGDIDVDVGGSLSELELEFSSEEHPDPTDVMSILVLGKPPSALSESEGQMGGALLGAALGSVANSLTRAVAGTFFGRLEIDGDSFRMGVPVSNSVFATMEVRTADEEDENSLEMTLEWLLSGNLSAELVTGNQASTSADVYYRWRF